MVAAERAGRSRPCRCAQYLAEEVDGESFTMICHPSRDVSYWRSRNLGFVVKLAPAVDGLNRPSDGLFHRCGVGREFGHRIITFAVFVALLPVVTGRQFPLEMKARFSGT